MIILSLFALSAIFCIAAGARNDQRNYGELSILPLLLLIIAPLTIVFALTMLLSGATLPGATVIFVSLAALVCGVSSRFVGPVMVISALSVPLVAASATFS